MKGFQRSFTNTGKYALMAPLSDSLKFVNKEKGKIKKMK